MAKRSRRSRRKGALDWWQGVLDETKDFLDDSIDRVRNDDDDLEDDVDELREAVAQLNAKLDRLLAAGSSKSSPEVVLEKTPPSAQEGTKEEATP